ncbi:acetate/propionate family kinase [Furfurilactobacillus entadae]|uniref:acetate/propionate family kinase n=1 Tax=Furfurilactobacillus entadae TaxID=2922307 RepID=UPI0035EB92A6
MKHKVLAINSGSSSLKFKLYEMPTEQFLAAGQIERIGKPDAMLTLTYTPAGQTKSTRVQQTKAILSHNDAVALTMQTLLEEHIIASLDEIEGVGHRVSNGGQYYLHSVIVDETVEQRIQELSTLSPLHNPVNLQGIKAFGEKLPQAKQVAVFDTSFNATIPMSSALYPLPYEYYEKYGIKRFGFHGPSHQYIAEETHRLVPTARKVISCHLGNGASISAILDGKTINNSMGFTPLAGLMMGTRSGDIDPQIIPFLEEHEGMDSAAIKKMLNECSGLLGVSGISNDLREIEEAAAAGNERARLALTMYVHQIVFYIGAYAADLDGVDAITFTAGVGEHSALIRRLVTNKLKYLGVQIDLEKNEANEQQISTPESAVTVLVVPTDEEVVIARDVTRLLGLEG